MSENAPDAQKKDLNVLIEQFRDLNRRMTSDLEKLAEIHRQLRSMSDHDVPIVADSNSPPKDRKPD